MGGSSHLELQAFSVQRLLEESDQAPVGVWQSSTDFRGAATNFLIFDLMENPFSPS